ncbi:hypothetical protein N1851_026841 [Merluccius polli]|uniref:Alkylated DNA repair protein AlkB homologue 8 N-terminal domain-containing protein n=1 Tax=Merluccius polli TaxID=89951 RepID=A0AA47MB99_MERPO|nr:hypothetical protein N1851_026841 [Merluccius polli]
MHLTNTLTWRDNTMHTIKKAHQRLYFLRKLKGAGMSTAILKAFYRCVVESILTSCITVWYCSCTVAEKQALQRVVNSAQRIISCSLPSLSSIYITRCKDRAASIMKDSTHPAHGLFTLLPSGRRLRCIWANTNRLRNTFYPDAIRLLNC